MAAKWEFEDNKNIPNSRTLLQRGLRVNPSSKQLWLEVNKTPTNNYNNIIIVIMIIITGNNYWTKLSKIL